MNDAEIERKIRQAGYDIQWEAVPGSAAKTVYALLDGKRHTRPHATLLALAQYLGRIDRPVQFVEDRAALESAISKHAEEKNHFVVRRESCRVALFKRNKYVQLVEAAGHGTAMYELSTDGLRRTSNSNLPAEVVEAFASEAAPARILTAADKASTR